MPQPFKMLISINKIKLLNKLQKCWVCYYNKFDWLGFVMIKIIKQVLKFFIIGWILGVFIAIIRFLFYISFNSLFIKEFNKEFIIKSLERSDFIGVSGLVGFVFIWFLIKRNFNYDILEKRNLIKLILPIYLGSLSLFILLDFLIRRF